MGIPVILRHQVQAMVDDLVQAQDALEKAPASPRIAQRVGHDYTHVLESRRSAGEQLRQRLRDGDDPAAVWESLRELRRVTHGLLPETLAFIQGSLARDAQVAVDACDLADALLDDLDGRLPVKWRRFTVMAEAEYVSGPADVIRLRFPEASVWSLPIVAHELGHFVSRALYEDRGPFGRRYPLNALIAAEADAFAGRQLDETIADVFAVWTVGPAYAMTCQYLRFDPTSETEPWSDHPGDVERMEVIMSALRAVASQVAGHGSIVERLQSDWEGARAAAGSRAVKLSRADRQRVTRRVDAIVAALDRHLLGDALYRGWRRAEDFAPQLAHELADDGGTELLEPWDVVNAGWRRRLDVPPDDDEMGRLARATVELCWRRLGAA